MTATETSSSGNPSLFYRLFFDKELRSVTIQVITMALIFAFFFFIVNNAITNLETIGKGYSFSFLWDALSGSCSACYACPVTG
jgi:ABC-type amino acid transport system permease subunit